MDIPGLQRTCTAEAAAFPCQPLSSEKGASERRTGSQHLLVDTSAGIAPESLHWQNTLSDIHIYFIVVSIPPARDLCKRGKLCLPGLCEVGLRSPALPASRTSNLASPAAITQTYRDGTWLRGNSLAAHCAAHSLAASCSEATLSNKSSSSSVRAFPEVRL